MQTPYRVFSPLLFVLLTLSWLAIPATSHAQKKTFDRIVVFGDSLSDSGNAFFIIKDPSSYGLDGCDSSMGIPLNVPPYDALDEWLVPDGVYARGGHHVSNGATWIEQYARSQALAGTTRPALQSDGTKASNYAVGGARAGAHDCRFNLEKQLSAYKDDFPITSAQTLVVIEIGTNDIFDVLKVVATLDPTLPDYLQQVQDIQDAKLTPALTNILNTITELYLDGARHFLVVNIPKIDITPPVRSIGGSMADYANQLTVGFNAGLSSIQELFGDEIVTILDIYSVLDNISKNPSDYGIANVNDPCVTPYIPPYTCAQPDTYMFWDGIHPTKAVHAIVAQKTQELLLVP